ncbi:MAG TPA: DUF1761 domain-containing protein [Bacteroidia bacterium]|nr:DUF1761 domain-containing protein [Bacteroidia bacterium]
MIQEFFSNAPWLQIAVAAIAYFALGALWYIQPTFGKAWVAGHKIVMDPEAAKKKMPMLMTSTFILGFLLAIVCAMYLGVTQTPEMDYMQAIKMGLFVSAFVVLPMATNYMYLSKSFKVFLIDAGYHTVGITLMCIILNVWQ